MKSEKKLLSVENLSISFGAGTKKKSAISDISFSLYRGETIGIVGESGSGKSLTSLAIMGLLPHSARIENGKIDFFSADFPSKNLLHASELEMQNIRGKRIAMIFQEPMTSLNPVHTCGKQVAESLIRHLGISKSQAKTQTIELFREVELPGPEGMYYRYPHQISGGQKQRVMIAMALSCKPDIIIADEPTTALDVTVQKHILKLLQRLKSRNNMGMIFITHDLGLVSELADNILVMYRGKVVEESKARDLFESPKDPYTKALINCKPRIDTKPWRLPVVSDYFMSTHGESPLQDVHLPNRSKTPYGEILVRIENLNVWYPSKRDWLGRPLAYTQAVNDVGFEVKKGETLGLVGESGCGKSTLGRAILRLIPIHSGKIWYGNAEISNHSHVQMKGYRKKIQLIFQDPYSSLNPRMNIWQTLMEPLAVHGILSDTEARNKKIHAIMDRVGLEKNALQKYPHEFSGGQRQRICIARALMVEPEFIVCDESVSALDVSVQAQVLNLLNELKEDFNLTFIFISHDLSVVKYMSDRMIVMRRGKIEEIGEVESIYSSPQSDYTRELIASIPAFAY